MADTADALANHLERVYGVPIDATRRLDLDVFRVDRKDGSSWVARVFPASRPPEGAEEDAAILQALEERGFPAERCADPDVVVSRYRRRVELSAEELARLPGAIRARPLMLACWAFCTGRLELVDAVDRMTHADGLARVIAAQARAAFES